MIYSWIQLSCGVVFLLGGIFVTVFCRRIARANYRLISSIYSAERLRGLLGAPVLTFLIGVGFLTTGISAILGAFQK